MDCASEKTAVLRASGSPTPYKTETAKTKAVIAGPSRNPGSPSSGFTALRAAGRLVA